MKTVMVWETLPFISGGQSMTLLVCDLLKTEYNFVFLLPQEGALSDALDSRGIKYFFLGDQTLPCGVKGKKAIPLYAKMSFTAITKARKIVKRIKPDLIYVPGPAALPWGTVIGMLSHLPVVWHLHHLFLDGMTKKLLNSCSRLKAVRRIIGVSKCVSNQITSVEGSGKLLTIYNPIDITRYSSGVPNSLLVEFPQLSEIINGDRLVIGQIALIQEMKCQEKVIEIAAAVRDSGRKVFAVFIGATRNGDEGYRLRLESFVEEMSLSDSVLFTGFRSDVQNWLTLFDVLAIPSVEGLPLAGMEAASAGVPIFALDEGGAKELIDVSGAGMCFSNTDSHEELADKIIHCAECEQYSENGKRFARLQSFDRYRKDVSAAFRQAQGLE